MSYRPSTRNLERRGVPRRMEDRLLLHRERQLDAARKISEALFHPENLDDTIRKTLRTALDVIGADAGSLLLADEHTKELVFRYVIGDKADLLNGIRISWDKGVAGAVFLSGQAEIIENVKLDSRHFSEIDSFTGYQSRDMIVLPLRRWGGQPIGVLEVLNKRDGRLNDDDVDILMVVGALAAAAIEQTRAVESLRQSEAQFQSLGQSINDAVVIADQRGRIQFWNDGAQRLFGYEESEMLGAPLTLLMPERYRDAHQRGMHRMQATGAQRIIGTTVELHGLRANGSEFPLELSLSAWKTGTEMFYGGIIRDITARKQSEQVLLQKDEQLREASKIEAIGRLAGGIAHDFNNVLTVIAGHTHLLLHTLPPGDDRREEMEQIKAATERAASLTQQLLAFSRRQVLQRRVLNLNTSVKTMEPMLRRLIGEDLDLTFVPHPRLGWIKADPAQIEQVLMNLCVNARDAMPQGGRLTIETEALDLPEAMVHEHWSIPAGQYALLSVTDTGAGMDADTQAKIFEPFFTTKTKGKGTGLGLSVVYGIVKQSGGYIKVQSEPGRGTRFIIYLPTTAQEPEAPAAKAAGPENLTGTETVLVVEDDTMVRRLICTFLRLRGYTVLDAPDGKQTLSLLQQHDGPVHLLMVDVVMPDMSGRELALKVTGLRPSVKVIFMSGYMDDTLVRHGVQESGIPFLQKPYNLEGLLRKVREVLDSPPKGC